MQKEKQFRKINAEKQNRQVKVTRDNKESLISVHDILAGDVLHLKPGDIVAAELAVIIYIVMNQLLPVKLVL